MTRHFDVLFPSTNTAAQTELARRCFTTKHGLEIAVLEGFAATDSHAIGPLGPENANVAFARQASVWAVARQLGGEPMPGWGGLLDQRPAG